VNYETPWRSLGDSNPCFRRESTKTHHNGPKTRSTFAGDKSLTRKAAIGCSFTETRVISVRTRRLERVTIKRRRISTAMKITAAELEYSRYATRRTHLLCHHQASH